jgi:hypothetical protein
MLDFEDIVLSCSKWQELPGAYNRINAALPPGIRKRMADIMINYMARFGPQGVFERMNNRSISQILAEYDAGETKVIAAGETEGVKWQLFEGPSGEGRTEGTS